MQGRGDGAAHAAEGANASVARDSSEIPIFELVILALGFGLCRVWIVDALAFASFLDVAGDPLFFDQVFLFSGALVCCVLAAFSHRLLASKESLSKLNVCEFVLITASLVLMGLSQVFLSQTVTLFVAFSLAGVASGILQILWGERFVRHSVRLALLAAPAAAVVTSLVMMAIPQQACLESFFIAPFCSLFFLCANKGQTGSLVLSFRPEPDEAARVQSVQDEKQLSVSKSTFIRLMASIAIFSMIGRSLDSFPIGESEHLPEFVADNYPFLAILVVGIVFITLVLASGKKFDVLLVYRLSLPIMVAGFVILTAFMDRYAALSIVIITIGYEFFDILFWVLLVGVVRNGGYPPTYAFGWGVGATYWGMGFGVMGSRMAVAALESGSLEVSILSLLCILVLVILVVLVLPEGTLSRATSGIRAMTAQSGSSELDRSCELVAAQYDLTPRELDVLKLLARGRTLSVVSRELGIAEGTARTHMGHIYAKLGVHRQQELIDLIESAKSEQSD